MLKSLSYYHLENQWATGNIKSVGMTIDFPRMIKGLT